MLADSACNRIAREMEQAMKVGFWLGACALILASGPLGAGDKDKFDAEKLVGKWTFVSGVKNGDKMTEEQLKKLTCELTKDSFILQNEAGKFTMKYELDTKKTPIGIKVEITEGPVGVGSKAEGVIELKGDDFKLCYAPMGGEAPKTFEAKEGSMLHLFALKRSK
jgi:uncharacterized protein (TIGR03067 family)